MDFEWYTGFGSSSREGCLEKEDDTLNRIVYHGKGA